jgi:hypothetical protein
MSKPVAAMVIEIMRFFSRSLNIHHASNVVIS